eukprot:scaffold52647_cov21-Tisochrysis_lutea.AAC.1
MPMEARMALLWRVSILPVGSLLAAAWQQKVPPSPPEILAGTVSRQVHAFIQPLSRTPAVLLGMKMASFSASVSLSLLFPSVVPCD